MTDVYTSLSGKRKDGYCHRSRRQGKKMNHKFENRASHSRKAFDA